MHNQSVVRVANSRHDLQTRILQDRHGAPRFIIRPSSALHLEHVRFDSMNGRSSEPAPVFSAPFQRRLCSSARSSL